MPTETAGLRAKAEGIQALNKVIVLTEDPTALSLPEEIVLGSWGALQAPGINVLANEIITTLLRHGLNVSLLGDRYSCHAPAPYPLPRPQMCYSREVDRCLGYIDA